MRTTPTALLLATSVLVALMPAVAAACVGNVACVKDPDVPRPSLSFVTLVAAKDPLAPAGSAGHFLVLSSPDLKCVGAVSDNPLLSQTSLHPWTVEQTGQDGPPAVALAKCRHDPGPTQPPARDPACGRASVNGFAFDRDGTGGWFEAQASCENESGLALVARCSLSISPHTGPACADSAVGSVPDPEWLYCSLTGWGFEEARLDCAWEIG